MTLPSSSESFVYVGEQHGPLCTLSIIMTGVIGDTTFLRSKHRGWDPTLSSSHPRICMLHQASGCVQRL